jgi:hypothetical protein
MLHCELQEKLMVILGDLLIFLDFGMLRQFLHLQEEVHSFASLKQEQLRLMHLARVQVQES